MPSKKFYETGLKREDDPYEELFADCETLEDIMQLQADIERAEASE